MPRAARPSNYVWIFSICFLLLVSTHSLSLRLPYFWDEMGQFVPAALDIFDDGAWIPHSTTPNVHPPGVMAYLAFVWKIFGYSILATRLAMLAVAAAAAALTFLLAIVLCGNLPGAPAFYAVLLLLLSPLMFMQAEMAQLDMPAMPFTLLALLLFFKERHRWAALACICLVLTKETGALVPLLLAAVLLKEKRPGEAIHYLGALVTLCVWLLLLWHFTGTPFGNKDFAHYNLFFPLNPVRLAISVFRRLFYVFADNFHWIGTIAIGLALRWTRIFRTREWSVCGALLGGHLLLVSFLGGATLERYVLPVLPLFYIAVAAAWTCMTESRAALSRAAMTLGLLVCIFINPPWPFPYENNTAAIDFVKLQQGAAEILQSNFYGRTIASAWPFPDALRRPEFGYVTRAMPCVGIDDFHRSTVLALKPRNIDVLVVYERTWEPPYGIVHIPWVRDLLRTFYYYEPQITAAEIEQQLGLLLASRLERRGQWIEIYAKRGAPVQTYVRLGMLPSL